MDLNKAKKIVFFGVSASIMISAIQWCIGLWLIEEISPQIVIAILKSIGIALIGFLVINWSNSEHEHLWILGGLYLIAMPLYFGGLTTYRHLALDYGFRTDHLVLSFLKHVFLLSTVPAYIFITKHVTRRSNT